MAEKAEKEKAFRLRVLTPTRVVFDDDVDLAILRAKEGDMGILRNHEPCAVTLGYGILKAFVEKQTTGQLAVMGGFATMKDNVLTILSPVAAPPDKIEETIAAIEAERAANQAREAEADIEMLRMENALRHTLVQMDISSYAIIKGREENLDQGPAQE